MSVCITDIPRPAAASLAGYANADVATVHEAQGRTGLIGAFILNHVFNSKCDTDPSGNGCDAKYKNPNGRTEYKSVPT